LAGEKEEKCCWHRFISGSATRKKTTNPLAPELSRIPQLWGSILGVRVKKGPDDCILWFPENWSTGKGGQRGQLVNGKVVNAEIWSMRKSGQRGKVVNGKLVNGEKARKCQVLTLINRFSFKIYWIM
jgi:hypothetical protein